MLRTLTNIADVHLILYYVPVAFAQRSHFMIFLALYNISLFFHFKLIKILIMEF